MFVTFITLNITDFGIKLNSEKTIATFHPLVVLVY